VPLDLYTFLVFMVPATIIGLRFALMMWPEAALPESMRVKKDPAFKPTVAVIIPCYNEGAPVYDSIKSIALSDYPADKLKIYPQDDGSKDNSYGWMMKASYDFPNVFPQENGKNCGKTITYLNAIDRSESDIVIVVDSDVTISPETIARMMANFADPKMGVVGAVVGVSNANHSPLTALQTQLYFFGQRLAKVSESHFQGVAVIGGYALAVRRHLILELKPEIVGRNWFGVPVKDGEDRFITHLSLLRGWNTYIEQGAETRTAAMDTYAKFFGQQLRWKRSLIRTFFWVIRTLPMQFRQMNLAALLAMLSSVCIVFLLFSFMLYTALINPAALISPDHMLRLLIVGTFVNLIFTRVGKLKDQWVLNPFKMGYFLAWWVVNEFYLVILSLVTLDQDAWGNREIKIKQEKK
jgi:hyaluronan synthase